MRRPASDSNGKIPSRPGGEEGQGRGCLPRDANAAVPIQAQKEEAGGTLVPTARGHSPGALIDPTMHDLPMLGIHPPRTVVKPAPARMNPSIFRPLRLATLIFLIPIALGILVSSLLTAREERRLYDAHSQLQRLYEFDYVRLQVASRLVAVATGTADPPGREQAVRQIDRLIELSSDPDTPPRLRALRLTVQRGGPNTQEEVTQTLILFHEVTTAEHARKTGILADLEQQSASQFRLELIVPLSLIAIALLLFPLAQQRLLRPLDAFGRQLARLADGNFTPAPVDDRVQPFLLPLHRQFNELASRLQQLEALHRERAAMLEAEVRIATAQLLDQQRTLGRAERLAATGELAASVAHELRNPLAGIQMSLSNLRSEIDAPDLVERVDLITAEVARLGRLLNEVLDSARHVPEPARPIQLGRLVDEMLALTRYQLAENIRLENGVDASITCRMPADHLRQALLNLILNAAGALSDRGGTIHIDAALQNETLRIAVRDDGPGFPPELLAGGIRPFFSTRDRGTGLGLAMVRRFARDVGGTLELANVEPHGARVTLVLPLNADLA